MIGTAELPTVEATKPLDSGKASTADVPEQFNRAFVYLGV